MSPEHQESIALIVAMSKLVVLSMVIERGLAFIYEYYWFVEFNKGIVDDPQDKTKKLPKFPWLKGTLALVVAIGLCLIYKFDILAVIFADGQSSKIGMCITGLVTAGGSSGAMAMFQGVLGISKDSRDASIAAKTAEANANKQVAESKAAEAKANQEKAEAEAAEAKANQEKAEAEAAEAKANQEKAEAEAKIAKKAAE